MHLEVIHRLPESANRFPVPLLFIHGSYCAAWVWDEHFLPYLAQQGFDSYAVSLRGHGRSAGRETLKKARIADFIADVNQVIAEMPRKPVLLGHSLGGGVVERYLAQYPDTPAGVLIAPAPYAGIFTSAIQMLRANPKPVWDAIRQRDFKVLSTQVTRSHMMANVAPERRADYLARLEPEESVQAIVDLEFHKVNPRRIHAPLLLLGGCSDQMVYDWQIERTGKVFNIPPHFFPGMGHEMMLESGWQQVADCIIDWLHALNLS